MNIIFEDAGKLHVGRIISQADTSSQVELPSGKRVKLKNTQMLLPFEASDSVAWWQSAQAVADGVDVDLAWEFAPEGEFGFDALAKDYFSDTCAATERAAMLLALQAAPHYFRRCGKGVFKKASQEVVQQALAAIEKKRQQQLQIDAWATQLAQGQCPEPVQAQLYKILFKPDKNALEYKAVLQAMQQSKLSAWDLLLQAGALHSHYEVHWQRFLFDQFPKGTAFAAGLPKPDLASLQSAVTQLDALPVATVDAFSIDDSSTTEIDDALSVSGLGDDVVTVGIHIAAPALAFATGSDWDLAARERFSTVYMPGAKITMLPDGVVQAFSLDANQLRPAVSLYVRIQADTLEVIGFESKIERLKVSANLRHDLLEHWITDEWLTAEPAVPPVKDLAIEPDALRFLHRFAKACKLRREAVRGKPEVFNRPDYTFKVLDVVGDTPTGQERVLITERHRGSALDLIVAECMIVANSTWGQWLATLNVPCIYRSQASMQPGIKVRMGLRALPHAGMGVPCYIWATSPLRRYTDLVNQWQIIAAIEHGSTAQLVAPFKPKDAQLFAIISGFEATYSAYNGFQSLMERYWTLKHIEQQAMAQLDATVMKDSWVRIDSLPLTLQVDGTAHLARGDQVRLRVVRIDTLNLLLSAQLQEVLSTSTQAQPDATEEDAEEDAAAKFAAPVLALDVGDEAVPPISDGKQHDVQGVNSVP